MGSAAGELLQSAGDALLAKLQDPATYTTLGTVVAVLVALWMLVFSTGMYLQEIKSMGYVTMLKAYTFTLTWMTLSFLGSLPAIPLLLIGQRTRARELTHYNGGVIARTLQRICFYPSVITGMENLPPPETACVYVANHQSTVDIAVFFAIRRNYAWVSKASVFLVPGVGLLMRLAGYVSLQRGSKESGKKMMEDCRKDCLEKGWSVVIFPQGTRRRHKILDFKMGAFKLAQEARVPIVPVTIELPEKMYAIGCKDRPRLIIHKPIAPDDPLFQDRDALLAHTFGTIVGALSYGSEMLQRQRADAAAAARLTAAAAEVAPDAKKEA